MPTFAFQIARYALFTYAQCGDLDPFEVVNHLAELGAECIIGREAHADGGTHLHAFAEFAKRFRSRSSSVFDVGGRHPNVLYINKTPEKSYDYAIKDGDVVAGGLERPSGGEISTARDGWRNIAVADTREQFFQLLLEHDPRSLVCSFPAISKYADWKYEVAPEPYRHNPAHQFIQGGFPGLSDWVRSNLQEHTAGGKYFISSSSGRQGSLRFIVGVAGGDSPHRAPHRGPHPDGSMPLHFISRLTRYFRTGIIPRALRPVKDGEDSMGSIFRQTCILWRPLQPG